MGLQALLASQHSPACGFAPQLLHVQILRCPRLQEQSSTLTAEFQLCCLPANVQGITRCALYPRRH